MLVEIAIGDAYGAGFEYVRDRRFIRRNNNLSSYVKHPRRGSRAGCYTDDTQMSIAIAELVVGVEDWTPEIIATRFLDVFHRDKRSGYAGGFFTFLKKTKTGKDFIQNIRPNSDKSGAAMRACPIGVYPSLEEVIARCQMQAALTHSTPDGINAAIAASLLTHYFLYDLGEKSGLPEFLCRHIQGNWAEPWVGEVGSRGWMSVRAAITSLMKNRSLSSVLRSCIVWGGDTDTVAAIALAAASCSKEIAKDIPEKLVRRVENGKYGMGFLVKLDKQLMDFMRKGFS
jgi:ADP-ribosyl-[dinitrogen reductase] hydrolase